MANAVQYKKVQIDVRGCTKCIFHVYIRDCDQSGKGFGNSVENHPIKLQYFKAQFSTIRMKTFSGMEGGKDAAAEIGEGLCH